MAGWLESTLEWQNWGWNALIIGSLGTIIFTFIEGWGLWKQNESIWSSRSGESVSISWFSFIAFFCFAFFVYGLYIRSIAVILNGATLGILHIPILWGLWKFKRFSFQEKSIFVISFLMLPAMIFFPGKDEVYLAIAVGTLFAALAQPWEILHNKSAGVVDIRLIIVYLLSTVFWVIYSFSVDRYAMKITTSVALVILTLTFILWVKYRKKNDYEIGRTSKEV